MNIEFATDYVLKKIAEGIPPKSRHAFLEVGLGSINYSFEWASGLGYPCHAVEPIPVPALIDACKTFKVALTKAAIADKTGEMPMYVGTVEGQTVTDTSSLNPEWWGGGKTSVLVKTYTLADYLEKAGISQTSFLKIDTEGSESLVVGGLLSLAESEHPEFVTIEYGGGGSKSAKTGGWTDAFWKGTQTCADLLQKAGYQTAILLEEQAVEPILIACPTPERIEKVMPPDSTVGNLVFSKASLTEEELRGYCDGLKQALMIDGVQAGAKRLSNAVTYWASRSRNAFARRIGTKS